MARRTGLWWGTVEGAGFDELVAAAASAGFTDVSITPAMYVDARRAGASDADLRATLDRHGVSVAMIDPLISGLPGIPAPDDVGPRFRSTFEHGEEACYRAAEAVGASAVNVAHFLGNPTPQEQLVDAIGAIATRAAARGIDVLVEFMPDGSIPDLATAVSIVTAVDAANCALTIDTWHHWRCGGDASELRSLAPRTIGAVQLSDALDDVRGSWATPPTRDRLLPGEGVIPLRDLVAAARANRPDVLIGVEVFSRSWRDQPYGERAARTMTALRTALDA
ncbi:MAG TPA: sugar phosphate isomerase/epimerase [Acidimicrobiales bacterium]